MDDEDDIEERERDQIWQREHDYWRGQYDQEKAMGPSAGIIHLIDRIDELKDGYWLYSCTLEMPDGSFKNGSCPSDGHYADPQYFEEE